MGKASNAYLLPDTVSDVAAGLIDPLMVAYHAIHQSGLKLHDKVLVVGSGIIGQLIGGFDIAFEVVGAGETLDTCIDGVRPGGKIVMIGNSMDPKVEFDMNRTVLCEISVIGSVSCTRVEFEETIDLIAKGMIDPEKYVTDVLPLDQLQNAFEHLTSKTDPVLKIVIKP